MTISGTTLKKISKIVGPQHFSIKKEDLACYAYDATAQTFMPDAIVFPENATQISDILTLANQKHFYVIPRGSGSGMTGGALAVFGGIVMVMTRMNRIIKIDTDNLTAIVEPGVITGHLHKAVEEKGLIYPPDPSSSAFSTIGGNAAECAGGPRAVKYGVTRDYILGLEAVLPTGEIITTGVGTNKGVVGYDLTRLLVGSEGTLGIITQLTVRLLPRPTAVGTMSALFNDIENAGTAVSEIIRHNIIPRTIEYMDNASIVCVESYLHLGLPTDAQALLLIEVDGNPDKIEYELHELAQLLKKNGAHTVETAKTQKQAQDLWKARKAISPSLFRYGPEKINEDIVVPRSKIPQMVQKIKAIQKSTQLKIVSFGHAGDGNIHFNIMLDKKDKAAFEEAQQIVDQLFDYTLQLGGTISGEHGVGITKSAYIEKEIGKIELDLMRKIKHTFDPNGVLNPGKIFPVSK